MITSSPEETHLKKLNLGRPNACLIIFSSGVELSYEKLLKNALIVSLVRPAALGRVAAPSGREERVLGLLLRGALS